MEASYFDGSVTGRFRRIGIMIIARVVRLGLPSGLMNGQTRFTQGWVTLWPVLNTGETEEETRLKMACGRENPGSFWLNSAGSSWMGFVPSVLKRIVKN